MNKMLPDHKRILTALNERTHPLGEMCVPFRVIARESGIDDVRVVRRITRHLARNGLAEYHKGLSTEDGDFAGAGYCISYEGRRVAAHLES